MKGGVGGHLLHGRGEVVELDGSSFEVETSGLDLLSDERSVLEGGLVSAVFFELEDKIFRVLAGEVDSAFVADGDELLLGSARIVHVVFDFSTDGGMESTAKTSIGGDGDVDLLLSSLGAGIDGLCAHSEGSSRTDLLGRLGELGGGDHLHRLGDLLNVSDGLESDAELLELTRGVSGLNYDLSTSLHSVRQSKSDSKMG